MKVVRVRWIEHVVYQDDFEIPDHLLGASNEDINDYLDEAYADTGWPDGMVTDVTLREIISYEEKRS